jgi:hypothetical protein
MGVPVGVKQRRRTRVRVALGVGVLVVLALGLSQAILPRLAVQRVRDQVKPYGTLESVSVSAWPALELLWGKADAVSATARSLTLTQAQATKLVWEGRGVQEMNLAVSTLKLQVPGLPNGVVLHDVITRKRGDRLSTEATVTQHDLTQASPSGFQIHPLESAPGTVRVRASGALFGVQTSVDAVVAPREGKLIAQPLNIPFGGFVQLTLLSDPHVYLDGISAIPRAGGQEASWRLVLSGHLR